MKPETNPYAPGAGVFPPELAGRNAILNDAHIAIQRNKSGMLARSFMFVGLRGIGKTVLLNKIQEIADKEGAITDFIEVGADSKLSTVIVATLHTALLKLDIIKGASEQVKRGLRVLGSFIKVVKVKYDDIEVSLESEPGVADSGMLARDLVEVFVAVGEAAKARKSSIIIFIDEIQNLSAGEFEALIMAVHRTNQKKLPIMIVGAGLPSLIKLLSNTKSYVERLFEYSDIGPLSEKESRCALVKPAVAAKVKFTDDAIEAVVEITKGYPYFLQEWGYQAWNAATKSPIKIADIRKANQLAIERLDRSFFRSRHERLSNKERGYLLAMAELGPGPHETADIAKTMNKTQQQLSPTRNTLIAKGMVYSPEYKMVAFTVPLFDEFMKRTHK